MRKIRKRISCADLSQVLNVVDRQSLIKKTANSISYDITLANPFLREQGLDSHIICYKPRGKKLLLNRESPTYGMNNLIFRNLDIEMGLDLNWGKDSGWNSLQLIDWHFEHCRFKPSSPNMATISYSWSGFFRFYNNEFDFGDSRAMRSWLFLFESGSSVLFERNDFKNSSVQVDCVVREDDSSIEKLSWEGRNMFLVKDDSYYEAMIRKNHQLPETVRLEFSESTYRRSLGLSSMFFASNKNIDRMYVRCKTDHYVFKGINCIKHLSFDELSLNLPNLRSIYFGSRERIDPDFGSSLHHRELFLSLKKYGVEKEDSVLVDALNKHLDRIEYYLAKAQETELLGSGWLDYWQDRIRYEWRRLSSDFYRSWLRPLSIVVLGYVGLNSLPGLWIEGLSVSDWIAFSLRSIDKIPFYTAGLQDLHGSAYDNLSPSSKNWLRLIGLFQVVWVAIWGFALSKSIKR